MANKPYILFVSGNSNQTRILTRVAGGLSERGHLVKFLSLDPFYGQDASQELEKYNFPCEELNSQVCCGQWFSKPSLRSAFVKEAALQVEELFFRETPVCVVLGHDVAGVEQIIIRAAERYGAATVLVQDGNQSVQKLLSRKPHSYYCHPGDGGCELLCMWSNDLAQKLLALRGVGGKIVATGNPRFDTLEDWPGYKHHSGPYKVLIATQCFSRHLNMTPAEEIAIYERLIRQILERNDVSVVLKLHPQQTQLTNFLAFRDIFKGRLEISQEEDSLILLKQVDMLITVTSTVGLESALMGIPTALLPHIQNQDDAEKFMQSEREFLDLLESTDFPKSFNVNGHAIEKFVEDHSKAIDGKAAQRVVSAIEAQLEKKSLAENSCCDRPQVSVLIVIKDGESWSSVRSALRQTGVSFEVVVVDPSPNGTLGYLLKKRIQDKRLRVLRLPGQSLKTVIHTALSECRGDIVARIYPSCVALPGWLEGLCGALKAKPEAQLAVSGFHLRDDWGITVKMCLLEEDINLDYLKRANLGILHMLAYAFRRNDGLQAQSLFESEPDFEHKFLDRVVGQPMDPRKISVVTAPLFLSLFSEMAYSSPLPEDIERELAECSSKGQQDVDEEEMLFSIILTEEGKRKELLDTLKALSEQTLSQEKYEVILACQENSSAGSHGTLSLPTNLHGHIISCKNKSSLGGLRNAAIEKASGKYLVFVGQHTLPSNTFLEDHLKAQQEHSPNPTAVMGSVRFCSTFETELLSQALVRGNYFSTQTDVEERETYGHECFSTANMSLPRSVFTNNGISFDSRFQTVWCLDRDIGLMLMKQGVKFVFQSAPTVFYQRRLSIHDIVDEEILRSEDFISLVEKSPQVLSPYFGAESISELNMKLLTKEAEEDDGVLDDILKQVEAVEGKVVNGEMREVVDQVSQLIMLVSNHLKRRALILRFPKSFA